MKRTKVPTALVLAAVLLALPAAATTVDAETEARVPALTAFHEVVYPLWHEAWPKKDVDALVALAPKVDAGVEAISKAELPGILRDKKAKETAFVAARGQLAAAVDAAVASLEGKDEKAIRAAVDVLHTRYQELEKVFD